MAPARCGPLEHLGLHLHFTAQVRASVFLSGCLQVSMVGASLRLL